MIGWKEASKIVSFALLYGYIFNITNSYSMQHTKHYCNSQLKTYQSPSELQYNKEDYDFNDYDILSKGVALPDSSWPVTFKEMQSIFRNVSLREHNILTGNFFLVGDCAENQKYNANIVAIHNGEVYIGANVVYNEVINQNIPYNKINKLKLFNGRKIFKCKENDILIDQFGNVWQLHRYIKNGIPLLCWQILLLRDNSYSNFIHPDIIKQYGELVPLCDVQINGEFKLSSRIDPSLLQNSNVVHIKPRYGIIVHNPSNPEQAFKYFGFFRYKHVRYNTENAYQYFNQEIAHKVVVGDTTLQWAIDDQGNTFWVKEADMQNRKLPISEYMHEEEFDEEHEESTNEDSSTSQMQCSENDRTDSCSEEGMSECTSPSQMYGTDDTSRNHFADDEQEYFYDSDMDDWD